MRVEVFECFNWASPPLGLGLMVLDVTMLELFNMRKRLYTVRIVLERWQVALLMAAYAASAAFFAGVFSFETAVDAVQFGALLGAVVFFVFNVTVLAINEDYNATAVPFDVAWGAATWALLFWSSHHLRF